MTDVASSPAGSAPSAKPDPRYLALRNFAISMSVFNIIGYSVLGFEQPWLWPFLAVVTGYTTEIVLELLSAWAQRRSPRFQGRGFRGVYEFLLPSHITALAVNMLLYANNQILPVLFGVFVGVAGKHVLQAPIAGRMRHYMNPSNFGITLALVCFGSWVSIAPPYEFTENADTFFRVAIPLIIVTAGTIINTALTKRTALIVGWLGGFVIQALIRHWFWDVALASALGPMSGVAFVLFTNYMISDPGTTPTKGRNQFVFGASVAVVYGIMMLFNVVYTLFFATTVVCALRGIGWWVAHFVQRRKTSGTSGGDHARGSSPELGDKTTIEAVAA
ncbi:enediyne biosynthesis protein [Streptomyces sp. NBC_00887]|uniref:enediyne biosynthesis protein n=1 Tax=Streptomyces sp. NBC_00887 TaxID=2975859 RepID=UPI002F916391|nr:enediyne biosynthesis protein [Streptomyces sp. NBC_00887]